MVDGSIPGLLLLGSKKAEAMGIKPVNSTLHGPLYHSLPPGPCLVSIPVVTFFSDEQQCGIVS